jgi:hypothetical protein
MKKIFSLLVVLTLMAVSLFGCNTAPFHFTGEWKFSKVNKVEFLSELPEGTLDVLKELYGAENEEDIIKNAFDRFVSEKTFENFYLKFDGKYTYTYDPFMDREATWFFYKTGEYTGFISYDGELEVTDKNPFPEVFHDISYNADTDTMFISITNYSSFMITLELKR